MPKKKTAKSKKPVKKPIKTKASKNALSSSRRLKRPEYKSFRLSKRLKHPGPRLSASWKLFWRSLVNLGRYWLVFGAILAIYIILTLALVKGFSVSGGLVTFKETLTSLSHSLPVNLTSGFTLLNFLISNSGPSSDVGGAYLTILLVIVSLAVIWTLRQTQAGVKVSISDPFYKGLYPLVPMILVLLVIGLETLPLLGANLLFGLVITNGVAVSLLEKTLWSCLIFLLALLTIYMITSSIFALYIVTLPDVKPIEALRSARDLVRYRRWTIMRKLLFLPLVLVVIGSVIIVPLVLYLTVAAEWVYFVLTISAVFIIHSYIYALYRELLA
ncbi:MAG TPA: hypothetical protein VLF39_02050 [Candidatus Saccharimonadales bacterium]|nr:hypothetical protein [Candidatus Saccharimonadales bacterium]